MGHFNRVSPLALPPWTENSHFSILKLRDHIKNSTKLPNTDPITPQFSALFLYRLPWKIQADLTPPSFTTWPSYLKISNTSAPYLGLKMVWVPCNSRRRWSVSEDPVSALAGAEISYHTSANTTSLLLPRQLLRHPIPLIQMLHCKRHPCRCWVTFQPFVGLYVVCRSQLALFSFRVNQFSSHYVCCPYSMSMTISCSYSTYSLRTTFAILFFTFNVKSHYITDQ